MYKPFKRPQRARRSGLPTGELQRRLCSRGRADLDYYRGRTGSCAQKTNPRPGARADLGCPQLARAARAAVTARRCSELACGRRRPPVPAREEGTGRSRWCCGKWQEREAGTHLEAPRRRCRASCGVHQSKCRGRGRERPRRRRLPEWLAAPYPARKVSSSSGHVVAARRGVGRMEEEGTWGTIGFGTRI